MKFISLRWKISGILVLSNLILGLILIIIVNRTVSGSLSKELIDRGRTIGLNLAQYSAEQILAEDAITLRHLLTGSLTFESVEYILVHNSEGAIIADNYNGDVPAELANRRVSDVNFEKMPELINIERSNTTCFDIWVPVEEGYLGFIRVGMKKVYIDEAVRQTTVIILSIILGVTLIGIIIVLLLANRIIKPIIYLTRRADEISQGKLDEKVILGTRDEIENLGQALERLRESVKIALDRLKKQQTLRM